MKFINININKIKQALLLMSFYILTACSLFGEDQAEKFQILEQGKNIESRPNMAEVCEGFYISPEKFDQFFEHATLTYEEDINERYKSLPCYSSGISYIDHEKFNWIIRAGGVGEFFNDNKHFTKICGIACCSKVSGVC